MVPEGWQQIRLDRYAKHITSGSRGWAEYYADQGDVFVRITNLRRSSISPDWAKTKHVQLPEGMNEGLRTRLQKGDILISITADLGIIGYIHDEPRVPHYINQHVALVRLGRQDIEPEFVAYALSSSQMRNTIQRLNDAGAKAGLSLPTIRGIPVTLPPLPEQHKIVEILSTWDRAIEVSEALLATATAQKRSLMQSLLTGHRRFPEFEGQAWKEVRLGDVTTLIASNVDKKLKDGERPVRLCNYTDVYKRETIDPDQKFMEATATPVQIKKFGLKVGDVIITKDSETADDIAMPTYVVETAGDLVCGYHLAIVRPDPEVDGRFLKFFFELPHTRYYFGTRANGAIRFGLTLDGIKGAKLQLPPVEEQRRMAAVIANIEAEIAIIVSNITHLRAEKRALMQQLLTGKRRVVVERISNST